tara:strand:+ start:301 stop:738 length:438 start_codon:yes stop_codon:yes gene_type:complete
VPKRIHPITKEAAYKVASNLTEADKKEVFEGHGITNVWMIVLASITQKNTDAIYTSDGKIAAMIGVEDGRVWMLSTPACKDHPRTFVKDVKQWLLSQPDGLYWNIVDKRNTVHIRLLRLLGFKFLRELNYGPNNLPFLEFCKIQW